MIFNENGEILNESKNKCKWNYTNKRYNATDINTKKFRTRCDEKKKKAVIILRNSKQDYDDIPYINRMEEFISQTDELIEKGFDKLYHMYSNDPSTNTASRKYLKAALVVDRWWADGEENRYHICGEYDDSIIDITPDEIEHGWSMCFVYDDKNFVFDHIGQYMDEY